MSKYLGDFTAGAVFNFKFSTKTLAQVPATFSGSPVLKVYKAGATDSETTTGVTLTVDFDSVTGLNNVAIDTSNAFYAIGNNYQVVVTAGTVGGVSVVGSVVREFSIQNRNVNGFKKNKAFAAFPFVMIDSSDDVSGKTGAIVTAERSIDGSSFSACANSASEVGSGAYSIDLAASDLNADNSVLLKFTAAGANDAFYMLRIEP